VLKVCTALASASVVCVTALQQAQISHAFETEANVTIAYHLSLFLNCCTLLVHPSEATVAFTDDDLRGAVNDWISNQDEATAMYGDINSWDVSAVTNMDGLFYYASSFNQNISGWDVSKVTSMAAMFYYASSFNQNISEWDVSNVKHMDYMFYQAVAFNQNLCAWGCKLPGVVVTTTNMFQGSIGCPAQDNPSLASTPPGPFCYSCAISSCPTSAATSGP
jgi:surface protein